MTIKPDTQRLFQAMDATWAPASLREAGSFLLREGKGGGKRVSAASLLEDSYSDQDIARAETGMRDLNQTALFQLRPQDDALDSDLAARGYAIIDPVTFYAMPVASLAALELPPENLISGPIPLELMAHLWAAGGIDAARLAVMDRVKAAKRYVLLRHDNRGSGAAFLASSDKITMLHALETAPRARRQGLGRAATIFAGIWALEQGADWVALAALRSNTAACQLYEGLGFEAISHYHYRQAPDP